MRALQRLIRALVQRGEHGPALILFAGGAATLCGLVGLSVDIGQLVWTRADLQKAADAGAFAAARELPNVTGAGTIAEAYVASNSPSGTTAAITYSQTTTTNDTIHVTASRYVSYYFLKLFGMSGSSVSADATARNGVYNGGTGVLPWGLVPNNGSNSTLLSNACYLGLDSAGLPIFKQNQSCTLKYGAGENFGGDFGALVLDKTGADEYRENIMNGSTTLYMVGDQVSPQTGAMVGPTKQGVNSRLARSAPSGCPSNAIGDVLRTNSDGTVSIAPNCLNSPRIIIIPVVNQVNNPNQSTIIGFAFMFLEGLSDTGGKTQVTGQFITIVTPLPGGQYLGTGNGPTASILVQ
ncbi:MAG: pilus assembly protein TadG-related protein [Dehalococcoidia bacterium]